jgi:DNA mismatch endonuclease (patch repair protein)
LGGRKLPGKPDLILPKYRAVIFVHGCFWHRHNGCSIANTPKSNTAFWLTKFERNVERDERVAAELRRLGWRVFVAWECEVNSVAKAQHKAERLSKQLVSPQSVSLWAGAAMDKTPEYLEAKAGS